MREGITGGQYQRLTQEEIKQIHKASLKLLWNPGVSVENEEAKKILKNGGAKEAKNGRIRVPAKMVKEALRTTPQVIKMGARKEENIMILDGKMPQAHFVTGGCATKLVEFENTQGKPQPIEKQTKPDSSRGYPGGYAPIPDFVKIVRLIELLNNIDGLSRFMEVDVPENLQDLAKAFLFLNNTTKHCSLANLVDIDTLPKAIRVAEIVAGGKEALRENPLISFITCLTVSPLRLVDDTTEKFMRIVKESIPVVISSDPQAPATSTVDEMGQFIQNNAEILSAIVLSQLINPASPVLYGAIPLTMNLENLSPQWGSPEDFARLAAKSQLARFYGIPCYGTAAIPDAVNTETFMAYNKTHSYIFEAMGGSQYNHNAFGLYNTGDGFVACPELYIIDDELLARVKFSLWKNPTEDPQGRIEVIRKAIACYNLEKKIYFDPMVFMGDGRKKGRKLLYRSRHFQNSDISWERAFEVKRELLAQPVEHLPEPVIQQILGEFPELKEILERSE